MIEISQTAAALAGAVLALLVALSGWMLFAGLRARAECAAVREECDRLQALLGMAPAQAMVVRVDGRIELTQRLADTLGLESTPQALADLSTATAGLDPGDMAELSREVIAAQKAGKPFRIAVRARGSARTLLVVGQRAPDAVRAPGGVVLWFVDTTESHAEIARLSEETSQLGAAFEALTGLIQAAPMPMWYRGPDLRLAMVNSAYVDAVEGGTPQDVVHGGVELVDGEGLGGPLANAAIARDTGEPQMVAMPATIRGSRRMLQMHDVPLPTGGVAGFAVDIEDLEQARLNTKRARDAQRAMLDRLSAGVAWFAPDRTLAFVNQPFRRIFAMRNEWLNDRPEFDRVLERMREANRVPEVRDFPGWKAEHRNWFLAASGEIEENWHLPGGTHLRVVAQPLPEGGLLLIFEDRTEQVQLASARDTLLRVRTAMFDNLSEALGVFAADGKLQLWNTKFRAVWGFEEELLATHPRVDTLVKAAAPKLSRPDQATIIADLIRSATIDRQTRGGSIAFADSRYFDFAAVPLPDGNALFTMLDVSDSRRMETALRDRNEALEAADRVKTAFVANMSYELRTPLTSIKGFAEMLHGGFAGQLSDSAVEYSEAILSSVERLSALIDDVLDLTGDGGAPIPRERVDLELTAHAAAETVLPDVQAKRIGMQVDVQGSAGSVQGDPRRLRQAIEHLLRHAIAGTRDDGRILLHVDGTDTTARIIVSDDGPGMGPDAVKLAFDRFAQPGITRSGERALGLGLPLAKQFVEAHGGRISLISEPGQGTMVTIELPRG